jgi:hypothetical protein
MKRKLLVATGVTMAMLYCLEATAKIWRVNNRSNYNGTTLWGDNFGGSATYPVFKELNQANTSNLIHPSVGDTIYIEGSPQTYSGATITKKLVIIGPGYFLEQNPNSSNDRQAATFTDDIEFETGSAGSELIGVQFNSRDPNIIIRTGNITIKRCFLEDRIHLERDISNIYILQNFFSNTHASTSTALYIQTNADVTDIYFNNNVCRRSLIIPDNNSIFECKNNVFDLTAIPNGYSIEMIASTFQNNILKNPTATVRLVGGTISHNISASVTNQFGTANNNIVVTDMGSLFVDPAPNSTDGDYKLQQTQPANYSGSDGTERGAFGGASVLNRYTLSGLPAIPVIYEVNTSGIATQAGLEVNIKARTIK